MDKAALFHLTARLRRTFPRVVDVLSLCDEAERLAREPVRVERGKPKRDRAAYMRRWRADQKAKV